MVARARRVKSMGKGFPRRSSSACLMASYDRRLLLAATRRTLREVRGSLPEAREAQKGSANASSNFVFTQVSRV